MDEVSNNEAATANAPETNAPEVTPPSTTSATSAPQAATSEAPATDIAAPESDAPESDAPESDAPETTSAEAAPQAEITAGELLKAMRERAGVQLETIAATLKVSTQKLKALEANDFSSMPAVYFTRALAASVCRQLGQDPAPVLEKIPDDKPSAKASGSSNNADQPAPPTVRRIESVMTSTGMRSNTSAKARWLLAAIALMLAAAAALFFIPSLSARLNAAVRGQEPQANSITSDAPVSEQPEGADASGSSAAPIAPATLASEVAASSQAAVPSSAASATTEAPLNNTLQITATGQTWVKVSSSSGKTLYRRNLVAGQTHSIKINNYPVSVEVGQTENTQITDRGTPFDLSALASQGQARFELAP